MALGAALNESSWLDLQAVVQYTRVDQHVAAKGRKVRWLFRDLS